MIKVITYGTFDFLHKGHLRLLKRAKNLGDLLVVGVTADSFDRERGKINVQQTLSERIANVEATGLADQIIVEEYEGQKIDDIQRLDINTFVAGSDWKGKFDYLRDYCQVVYLNRTKGISSSKIRSSENELRIGVIGKSYHINKFIEQAKFINGIKITGIYNQDQNLSQIATEYALPLINDFAELLKNVDALYITSDIKTHNSYIRKALIHKKSVLCELPIVTNEKSYDDLLKLAKHQNCILMPALKTAYSTAYYRLLLLIKSGRIGKVVNIDTVCTSLAPKKYLVNHQKYDIWGSMDAWGAMAMLPIFQILGTDYYKKNTFIKTIDSKDSFDLFTKTSYVFADAVASFMVGKGIKSEGQLIISGTKGYIYVPAPWWKTDYFEIRYENPQDNKRVFYQLEGEGIRFEILSFLKAVQSGKANQYISLEVTRKICQEFSDFEKELHKNKRLTLEEK